ncbi:MAG: hypothetical protein QHG94_08530, partial [Candidatus Methanosuratincola sp.]|nr:hypothetical protein [Candidatus Methanosuratincola sp.]
GRLYIISPVGSIIKIIEPLKYRFQMFYNPFIVGDKILLKAKDDYMLYDYSGNLVTSFKGIVYTPEIHVVNNTIIVLNSQDNKYLKYSSTGQLLNTYTERPLELGEVKEKKLAPGRYKVTVKYPNKTWEIMGAGASPQYIRDLNGNLYGVGHRQVARYDDQGKELARLTMPEGRYEEESRDPGVEPLISVFEEYGSPVVAPNGDVYTWKRTPDRYYIIKWVWQ